MVFGFARRRRAVFQTVYVGVALVELDGVRGVTARGVGGVANPRDDCGVRGAPLPLIVGLRRVLWGAPKPLIFTSLRKANFREPFCVIRLPSARMDCEL
jgi:hypothetical protein